MTAPAHDGNVKWYWAPAVASLAGPTVAEITAATLLPGITNYDTPSSEAEVDISGVDDLYDTSVVGTSKAGPVTLTFKDDPATAADNWDVLTFRDDGFLIRTKVGPAIVGSKVIVYPAQVGQRRPTGYSRNAAQTFEVSFYVTADPELDAVVAA